MATGLTARVLVELHIPNNYYKHVHYDLANPSTKEPLTDEEVIRGRITFCNSCIPNFAGSITYISHEITERKIRHKRLEQQVNHVIAERKKMDGRRKNGNDKKKSKLKNKRAKNNKIITK